MVAFKVKDHPRMAARAARDLAVSIEAPAPVADLPSEDTSISTSDRIKAALIRVQFRINAARDAGEWPTYTRWSIAYNKLLEAYVHTPWK